MAGGREAQRMYGMEMGLRQQGASEIGQRFGEQMGRRGFFGDELTGLGEFANQAAMQDFTQGLMAGRQGFQDTLSAANFQNAGRQQRLNEQYRQADYYNQMRQQGINELIAQRGYSLNEAMALLSGQQVGMPQFNQFMGATKADTPQYLQAAGMQGQWNTAQSNADNAMFDALMGGLGQGIGMMGMFSDRRLKSDVHKIGERNGVNWYSYTIFGKPQIGVMADEVPWAAFEHPSGYMMVDYRKV